MILTFKDNGENTVEKILSILTSEKQIEFMQAVTLPMLTFPGLEIKLHQRRVLWERGDIPLTRLEYGTLAYLASNDTTVLSATAI